MGIFRGSKRRGEWRTWSVLADKAPPPQVTNHAPLLEGVGSDFFDRPGEVSVSIVRTGIAPDSPVDSVQVVLGGVYQRLPLDAARFLREHLDAAIEMCEQPVR